MDFASSIDERVSPAVRANGLAWGVDTDGLFYREHATFSTSFEPKKLLPVHGGCCAR